MLSYDDEKQYLLCGVVRFEKFILNIISLSVIRLIIIYYQVYQKNKQELIIKSTS